MMKLILVVSVLVALVAGTALASEPFTPPSGCNDYLCCNYDTQSISTEVWDTGFGNMIVKEKLKMTSTTGQCPTIGKTVISSIYYSSLTCYTSYFLWEDPAVTWGGTDKCGQELNKPGSAVGSTWGNIKRLYQ